MLTLASPSPSTHTHAIDIYAMFSFTILNYFFVSSDLPCGFVVPSRTTKRFGPSSSPSELIHEPVEVMV